MGWYVVLKGVPGAESHGVRWSEIAPEVRRAPGFVCIDYCLFHDEDFYTPPSRQNRYRARPFVVRDARMEQLSSHKTLKNAERAAREWSKNRELAAAERRKA